MTWGADRVRRWHKGLLVGIATGLTGVGLAFSPPGFDFETAVGLPWLYKIRGVVEAPPEIAVVAINEQAARRLQLPDETSEWPRSIHARLIDELVDRGASVIVFDMFFGSPSSPEDDALLEESIARAERVVLFERTEGYVQPLPNAPRDLGVTRKEELLPPLPRLAAAAQGIGPFALPRIDIAVSQYWTFKASVGDVPTMPAVALRIFAREIDDKWRTLLERVGAPVAQAPAGSTVEEMRDLRLALSADPGLAQEIRDLMSRDQNMSAKERRLFAALLGLYGGRDQRFLKFYGPAGTIPTISYDAFVAPSDAGADRNPPDLTGKAVFIGYSDLYEPDSPDRFATVYSGSDGVDLSGVEIAATAFGNLLTDGNLRMLGSWSEALILLAIGGVLGTATFLLRAMVGVPLALMLAILYGGAAQYGFNSADLWLPLATPVLAQMPMALLIGLLGQYALERRQKQLVTANLEQYVPQHVALALTRSAHDLESLNKVVDGLCLATDMSGFTTIAEGMQPKDLAAFMNAYFEAVTRPLISHHVDVTEFRADAIMCAWDRSQDDVEVREQAVLAALEVVDSINLFSQQNGSLGLVARVGLDQGPIYLGHTGGGGLVAYNILGDCANTASRIESLNKHMDTHLLASEAVTAGLDSFQMRPLGRFHLLGKSDTLSIVEVLARKTEATQEETDRCARFAEALQAYHSLRWGEAEKRFAAMLVDFPNDRPTRLYLDRSRQYQQEKPTGNDPTIIRMESK